MGWRPPKGRDSAGFSYIELVVVLGLVTVVTAASLPLTAQTIDATRAREGATYLEGRLRTARQQAAIGGRSVGLVFDQSASGWTFRICTDGNGNGLRRSDISTGVDPCPEGPLALEQLYPGVQIAVDPLLPGPEGDPPSSRAVKCGASNIMSLSPTGDSTAGTVFVRSRGGVQFAIRVGNISGRMRLLRFNTGTRRWEMA